jgi:excisionase family DNA binding protein
VNRDLPELVGAAEVARVLRCSVSAVYAMASRGDVPSYQVGSRGRRFSIPEVLKAIRQDGRRP